GPCPSRFRSASSRPKRPPAGRRRVVRADRVQARESERPRRFNRRGLFVWQAEEGASGSSPASRTEWSERFMNASDPVVAVVGATGAVGVELVRCLEERNFPLAKLKLLSSARSAGKKMTFRGSELVVEELTESSFDGVNIALFSAGSGITKKFGPIAVRAGAVVIDNSSAFRMDESVPLVVPEINADAIRQHQGIIANPNCSTIISITPLWPIHRRNRIQRLIVSTYQA